MKGLGALLIALLSGVALWQLIAEFQKGTFGVAVRPSMNYMTKDQVLRTAGAPISKYGENDGGETWQYTNGRVVRFNGAGQAVDSSGFSAFFTPTPDRSRPATPNSPTYVVSDGPNGTKAIRELPPNVTYLQSLGGGSGYRPFVPATPTEIERQRGWKSSSPLDEPAR